MPLTGVPANDPIPAVRRELIFGAGLSSSGPDRRVVIYGNKTSAGTETVDVLGTAILDDADCIARFGVRSEIYAMYRAYVAIDPTATIFAIAVTESGGVAAACDFTIATTATGSTTLVFTAFGMDIQVPIGTGDTVTTQAVALKNAINAADNGKLQITASNVNGVVTVTYSQKGPRGDYAIGDAPATFGLRARYLQNVSSTITKGNVVSGTTEDSATNAIASVMNTEIYYHIVPWTTSNGTGVALGNNSYSVTATDHQLGELMDNIITQSLPINGKDQVMIAGHTGTAAQAQSVAADAQMNSVFGTLYNSPGDDWTPGMIAAHCGAVQRSQHVKHPSGNFAGYRQTDASPFKVPGPYTTSNRLSATNQRADLNSGASPIGVDAQSRPYIVRHITTHCLNANGDPDFKSRAGHIPSAVHFAWSIVRQKWQAQKQPFVAADPVGGAKPVARTSTPSQVKAILFSVIDDLTSSKPLGIYDGPILAPDMVDTMKASVQVSKIPAGISAQCDFVAVEHNYHGDFTLREVGEAY